MNRDELARVVDQAFTDAGAIYGTEGPAGAIMGAATEHAAAAVAADRERIKLAVRHTCACESCKNTLAGMLGGGS